VLSVGNGPKGLYLTYQIIIITKKTGRSMLKKTLLSLAIATSTVGLTACNISSTGENNVVATDPVLAGTPGHEAEFTAVVFSAARGEVPVAIDFLFAAASTSDGTASSADTTPPVTTAINDLAGFSTTASTNITFSAPLDPATVIAGSSVWLVELKSNEDDSSIDALDLNTIIAAFNPATGASPFSAGADQLSPGADYVAEYVEMDNGATPTIRIHPLKPLDPKTKYIVVVTDKLKDTNGKTVVSSSEYTHAASNQGLISSALAPVRTAVQGWEQLAGGFLNAATAGGQTQDNVILSYAFTTTAGPDALKQYAAPSLFVAKKLPLANAEGLMESLAPGATTQVAQGVAAGSNALQGLSPGDAGYLDPTSDAVIAAIKLSDSYAGAIYSTLSAADLTAVVGSALTINGVVDRPTPRTVNLINSAVVDAAINAATIAKLDAADPDNAPHAYTAGASPATFLKTSDSFTRYIQGQIQLPTFLTPATLTTEFTAKGIPAAMAADSAWTANTTLGGILDAALSQPAGSTPPKDTDGSTNVTYRYPFPQSVGTDYSPVMITMPAEINYGFGTCVAPFPVVMYVHGITGARTNGLAYSAGLAANCIASVAIDLPLHGIAPLTSDSDGNAVTNAVLPFTVEPGLAAFTASPYAGVAANPTYSGTTFADLTEQHDSISQNGSGIRHAMDFDGTVDTNGTDGTPSSGKSGSTIINLFNFTRSRDNIQQAVVDLLNLNASLGNIDTALGGNKLDLTNVFVAGHSLGAIFATTFVAVNNDPKVLAGNTNLNKVQGVILSNGGSQLTKLLENSPSFGPSILGSLAKAGLTQGSSNLEKYFSVLQAAIDSVDPVMTGGLLAETGTPIVLFNMVGGDALPTDETELAGISYPAGFKGQGSFLPDPTVPNFDYFANGDTNPYAAFAPALGLQVEAPTARATMVGTNGLAGVMGLEVVNKDTVVADLSSPIQVVSRLSTGTHSTFANSDAPAAFTEMLTQSVTLIKGSFTVGNPAVLEASN
jgi:pimeloyl-ACP methyl ester carboxylesterase